ncbi:MAG: alpha/beta hydrolase [Rhizobiales bacterium]|nr:alpha/beta hydrolase [Hyphomicrobiales bacterium]
MAVSFETLEYDVGGTRTVIKAIGKGKPILFLHGASTLEGFDFAAGLADRFRVLCASHPGFGFSGAAPHVAGMSDMVVHYLDLLDALDLEEKPHLMGFTNLGALAPQDLPAYLAHDVSVALRYFPDGSDAAFAEAFGTDRAREGETLGRLLAPFGMGHPNLRRFLGRINNPALVVWGEEDRLLPASQAPLFVDALPDARLILVEDAGHFVMQEKPGTLTQVGDFLAG